MPTTETPDRLSAGLSLAKRWGLRLGTVVVVLLVLLALVRVAVSIGTQALWFHSVDAGGVYSTILRTEIILFVVFGGVAAIVGGVTASVVMRGTPLPPPVMDDEDDDDFVSSLDDDRLQIPSWRQWLGDHARLVRRVVVLLAVVVPAIRLGSRAAGRWQTWQLWRHATPWGVTDPTFHRDVSYYVEVYPMHRLAVSLLTVAVDYALVITVLAALVHGSLRWRGPRRITRRVVVTLSALGALWLVLKAFSYWLDRAALVTSQRDPYTGVSYTDLHAVAPGKIVMIVICALVAVLLLLNVMWGRVRTLAAAVAVMVVAAYLVGGAWPGLVMKFRQTPSASTVDLPQIQHNVSATLDAFGLAGNVTTSSYGSGKSLQGSALTQQADQGAQIRILDPNQLSPTFTVKQQLQAYYGFKSTLDIDRYLFGSSTSTARDVAIAARELHLGAIPQQSWANQHLVYTHGYGVVAAPTDSLNSSSDVPEFLNGGIPPGDQIPVTNQQIYFGQSEPNYSIVGQPAGSTTNLEFDHPGRDGAKAAHTTYTGDGGVPIGSTFRRLLYAVKMGSPSILFSNELNSASRILYVRDPRARVSAVAPWLTLDGDAYPTVVNGDITWVVDGYTTANNYPESQQVNLKSATTSTLTSSGSTVAQPSRNVNYMRNSVKATVDAYTGQVTLYEWNQDAQPDPLLKAWEGVFPGLVRPQSDMPSDLVGHLRYPQDLYNVQRQLLTKYHVTDPADFYSGNDFWSVPNDPTVAATQQLNAGSTGSVSSGSGPTMSSVYSSISPTGFGEAIFSLSSPLVTLNKQDLAGFLTVDSQPGPDYGTFTLLQFPASASTGSPAQVQNDIESDTKISEALTLQRGGNSKVVLGNLLSIPVGGRMLFVEPIYTQASGSSSFPILRHVVAIYGNGDPAFYPDLSTALKQALASGQAADEASSGSGSGSGSASDTADTSSTN